MVILYYHFFRFSIPFFIFSTCIQIYVLVFVRYTLNFSGFFSFTFVSFVLLIFCQIYLAFRENIAYTEAIDQINENSRRIS